NNSPTRAYEKTITVQLEAAGVLTYAFVDLPEISAREHFDRQVDLSSVLRRRVKALHAHLSDREYAFVLAWITIGRPLYVAEAARRAGVAYHVERDAARQIAHVEQDDRRQFASIREHLR